MSDITDKLHPKILHWIFKQGWQNLRPIQEKAVEPILAADRDILISASTAAGKTEAFFLPALSHLAHLNQQEGFGILQICPLKALINDQYRRISELAESVSLPVIPWHGDISLAIKKKARQNPHGILMTTPESLEAILINQIGWVEKAFANLQYIVIDEFHAFIGRERGRQLISLLGRLEESLAQHTRPIPRIALSATLGEVKSVPKTLRPSGNLPCEILLDMGKMGNINLSLQGFINEVDPDAPLANVKICQEVFSRCRGGFHLVFANNRQNTEKFSAMLRELCESQYFPNEFFPHHGSLAKDQRETLERRLQQGKIPTTAICTMTLELGIDIGQVESVIQIGAPQSVSSLKQRIGRSGRRGRPAILRLLIAENELSGTTNQVDALRLELVQTLAMIRLLGQGWFEAEEKAPRYFSTLLHQILATLVQKNGMWAQELFALFCQRGAFQNVSAQEFMTLLSAMGEQELIQQLANGQLILGALGDKITGHYNFYSVFHTPLEYRILAEGKMQGTIPLDSPIREEQLIVFAGRRWAVKEINRERKTIQVVPAQGGKPPLFFGRGMTITDRVRQEMRTIYQTGNYLLPQQQDFLDSRAHELLAEGRQYFQSLNLADSPIVGSGYYVYLFPWLGDKVANTLSALLIREGLKASAFSGVVEVEQTDCEVIWQFLNHWAVNGLPSEETLAAKIPEKSLEKFDHFLPESLLCLDYGKKSFDCQATFAWINETLKRKT